MGWTTVVIGLATSWFVQAVLTDKWASSVFGWPFNKREASDWAQAAGIMMNVAVASAWFLITPWLARGARPAMERERVDRFFAEMRTPVDFAKEEGGPGSDNLQAKMMGIMCLIYGGFITLLALIPNPPSGRLAFLFCGGVMFGVGIGLKRASKRTRGSVHASRAAATPDPTSPPEPAGRCNPHQLTRPASR